MIESRAQAGSGPQRAGPRGEPAQRPGRGSSAQPAGAYPLDALQSLVRSIEMSCEDLFAAAPFAGDQATGCSIDALVDQVVAALRSLQSEADDLRRVMAIAADRSGRGGSS